MTQLLAARFPLGIALVLLAVQGAVAQPSLRVAPIPIPDSAPAPEKEPSAKSAGPEAPTPAAQRARGDDSHIGEDLQPSLGLIESGGLDLRVGGLVQIHAAPYVGDDSLVENGDAATRAGFRLRRVRFGFEGRFGERWRMLLVLSPLQTDADVRTISDAKVTFSAASWFRLSMGVGKVPFSRGSLESSQRIASIERPFSVVAIAPFERLGATVEGSISQNRLAYLAAVANGSEGFPEGNRFGGILIGGRLVLNVFGEIHSRDLDGSYGRGLALGASAFRRDGPSAIGTAVSADIVFALGSASVHLEGLCDRNRPSPAPAVAPGLPDRIERCGAYAELGYRVALFAIPWELMVRGEVFDDNRALADAGDALLVSGGLNMVLFPEHVRAQLHYLARRERFGVERSNDAVILALQGSF